MEEIINLLLNIDQQTLINYINYFFIALAVVAIIGFIIGLIRGVYRTVSYELCLTICIILIVLFCSKLTRFLYNLDLNKVSFIQNMLPNSPNSIGEYVEGIVIQALNDSNIHLEDASKLNECVFVIGSSIVNIALYLVLLLLSILVVAPLLHLIIYNLVFRLLIPKIVRKKHKIRIVGALLTTLECVITLSLIIAPFTSIVNSMVGKVKDESGKITKKEVDNDYYNALMNTLVAYDNSLVSKMFFTISFEKGKSFDVSLMDKVSEMTFSSNQAKMNLYTEIGNVGSLFIKALETGGIGDQINYSLLLVPSFVNEFFNYLGESTLIQTILSLGLTIVTNMDAVKNEIDISDVDFYSVDWSSVTSALNTSFNALYEGGIIENLGSGDNILKTMYLDLSNVDTYKEAVSGLGNNDLVVKLMPKVISSYAKKMKNNKENTPSVIDESEKSEENKTSILDSLELPVDEEFYSDIMWGDELATLIDVFAGICQHYNVYYGEKLYFSDLANIGSKDPLKFLFGTDSVKTYDSLEEKYNKNIFVSGGKYNGEDVPGVKAIFGLNDNEDKKYNGLLDLSIFKKIFNETSIMNDFIANLDIKGLLGKEIDNDLLTDSLDELKSLIQDWKLNEWKEELDGLVETLLPLLDLVDKSSGNIFEIGENIECTFNCIDDSKILKKLLPSLLDGIVGNSLSFGENSVKPNFSNIENWGLEGKELHNLLDSIKDLTSTNISDISWTEIDNITQEEYNLAKENGYLGSFDDYYVENSKINKILTSIYKTQIIGGKYGENNIRNDGIFEDVLLDVLKSSLKTFDDKLDLDTCPESELIDLDFSLGNHNVIYSKDGDNITYVSWLKPEGTSSYRGEIANLSLLMSEIGNISGDNMSSLNGALKRMNESYILRNVIVLIINDRISFDLEEGMAKDFMDRADFDVFHRKELSSTPYEYVTIEDNKTISLTDEIILKTRIQEIEARNHEIESLIDIFDLVEEISDTLNETSSSDHLISIKKITANETLTSSLPEDSEVKTNKENSLLVEVSKALYGSKIFNTPVYDEEHNRISTTSFEYLYQYITSGDSFDVSNFLINMKNNPSVIYKITEENKWEEEIINFNDSLYKVSSSELIDKISDSDDLINKINELISSGTPIQDMFLDMHNSIILDASIGYALDKQFIPNIADKLESNDFYIENNIYEMAQVYYENRDNVTLKNTFNSFNVDPSIKNLVDTDKMGAFWKNEAASLEELISAICSLDFENMQIDSHNSLDTSLITDALEHSLCLNYLDDESHIVSVPKANERSIYQITVINLVDKINKGIRDSIELDVSTSTSSRIVSYRKEARIISSIVSSFQELNEYVVGGDISLNPSNASTISIIFKNFTKALYDSDVYHYLNNSERDNNKLSVFEQTISKMLITANLHESIYNKRNPEHNSLEEKNGKGVIEKRIKIVTYNDLSSSGDSDLKWFDEGKEIDKLCTLINKFNEFNFDAEANDLEAYFACEDGVYQGLLVDANNCYLLHDLVSSIIKDFMCKDGIKIDDEMHNVGEADYQGMLIRTSSIIDYYSIDLLDVDFIEKVENWNVEINKLLSITTKIKDFSDHKDDILSIAATHPFENVLPYLSDTILFKNVVDEITVSLLHDYASISFENPSLNDYSGSLARFLYNNFTKARGFIDVDGYLIDSYGEYVDYDWAYEGRGLDAFMLGFEDFIINKYLPYRTISGMPYPTWGEIDGYLVKLMTTPSHLKYVFGE